MILQFNSDTGTDYAYEAVYSNGSSAPGGAAGSTSLHACGLPGTGGYQGSCDILIPGYTSTTFLKALTSVSSIPISSSVVQTIFYGGSWSASAAAVTKIVLTVNGAYNFAAGTVATLYGMQ